MTEHASDTQKTKPAKGRPRLSNVRVQITMPQTTLTRISRAACRLGMNRSALISCLCVNYLDAGEKTPVPASR